MARLETQINQIYLTHPQSSKQALILYEEQISPSAHLFVLAELKDMKRKSEAADLKKISEIILQSFRANKKLAAENLFESSLSQINQNLADFAHEGHKSWVGKFSALLALKSGDNIFIANNGQTSAWLKRKAELLQILPAEKRGSHPLKSFTNFTQGKLAAGDALIITTANIFNYISFELFGKILNQADLSAATEEISKILQNSLVADQAFCSFLLGVVKKEAFIENPPPVEAAVLYAPLPEEIEMEPSSRRPIPDLIRDLSKARFPLSREWLKNIHLPSLKKFEWRFFKNLSAAGKFFFISFTIFALLFVANLTLYGFRSAAKKTAQRIDELVVRINTQLTDAQSSLIYKNDQQALEKMADAQRDFEQLKKLDGLKAAELEAKVQGVKNQVNKVSIVADPKVEMELKRHPIYMAKSPSGFLLGNQDSNALSLYSQGSTSDYFLLNSLKSDVAGVAFYTPAGVVVSTSNKLYHINNTLKQYEEIVGFADNEIDIVKNQNSNLYVHDKKNSQIMRINSSRNQYSLTGVVATKKDLRDFGMDKDVYLLYSDSMNKVTGGAVQAFPYPTLTDPITNATKVSVASNIYILEPTKKRLVVLSKTGVLQNQIYFPNATDLFDFYVDEPGRSIYLLDDNKLLKITF